MVKNHTICGVRTHEYIRTVDLKSTPLDHSGKMVYSYVKHKNNSFNIRKVIQAVQKSIFFDILKAFSFCLSKILQEPLQGNFFDILKAESFCLLQVLKDTINIKK